MWLWLLWNVPVIEALPLSLLPEVANLGRWTFRAFPFTALNTYSVYSSFRLLTYQCNWNTVCLIHSHGVPVNVKLRFNDAPVKIFEFWHSPSPTPSDWLGLRLSDWLESLINFSGQPTIIAYTRVSSLLPPHIYEPRFFQPWPRPYNGYI